MKKLACLLVLLCWTTPMLAGDFDYRLAPRLIAPGTYVLEGRNEDFSTANGGNIVNTGFIVTNAGVVVIDSGPSLRYGEQLRRAIATITDKPILRVFITHAHPDHFLGNHAFPETTVYATSAAREQMQREGNAFAENMYRLNGDWMKGTEARPPSQTVAGGPLRLGDHEFELLLLAGHTGSDLALYDKTTGVLFAGDLVFNHRAPTTPHAFINDWIRSLDTLSAITRQAGFFRLVPGHGPVSADDGPIAETRSYLQWLTNTIRQGAEQGEDMNEVMAHAKPADFRDMAVINAEFRRSVGHLFPAAEQEALKRPER